MMVLTGWISSSYSLDSITFLHQQMTKSYTYPSTYEGWNFNSGNYLFTTDTK